MVDSDMVFGMAKSHCFGDGLCMDTHLNVPLGKLSGCKSIADLESKVTFGCSMSLEQS